MTYRREFSAATKKAAWERAGGVGERTGSWKGGTIGCGNDLLPGETMEQSLRRMERDRTFR